MKHMGREAAMFVMLVAVVFGPAAFAQQPAAQQPAVQQPAGGQSAGGFVDLVGGLKATPGCLGVDTARTSSGKQVIFAWFENKKAALAWYYSETHRNAVHMFAPGAPARTPMADIPDDDSPILAIASLTPAPVEATGAAQPGGSQGRMPFAVSQIAIELYRPLPGGIAAGGRFAPSTLKVPGLIDIPMPVATSKQH